MEFFPAPLENLVEQFARLPGIGSKSAQRLAFHVLNLPQDRARAFADAILEAKRSVTLCPVCQNLTSGGLCPICASPKRDESTICVVADPRDVVAIERSREKQLSAQLLPNRKTAAQYRAAAEARQTLESRWQWVSALAATAGGTLTSKQKIRLEAYIQMNYLDRILRHANTRLMQMTAGQYELERIGAENQRSQSGLDLGVIDHYNGTRRSVKTLSGGESFKASLALALGLSDEVQSAAGGIRLDTLFLDEGFGSLDDESLEQAMRVLAGLTEGDRLVGIISHVGALKDRIDRQVVVRKGRTGGSTVELIV